MSSEDTAGIMLFLTCFVMKVMFVTEWNSHVGKTHSGNNGFSNILCEECHAVRNEARSNVIRTLAKRTAGRMLLLTWSVANDLFSGREPNTL